MFCAILPAEFEFVKRTRLPPEDVINASMNLQLGYLHVTNKHAENLNLDIPDKLL